MIQKTQRQLDELPDAGLVTLPNVLALPKNATPNSLDVEFGVGHIIQKRLGATTLNGVALTSTAATGFLADANTSLAVSLQAYWKLDEQSGARLDAFMGHDLVEVGSVGFGTGKRGNAAAFVSANTSYLASSDNAALSTGDIDWTVGFWVYAASTASDIPLVCKGQSDNSTREWQVRLAPGGILQFDASVNGSAYGGDFGSHRIQQATWTYIQAKHDATNNLLIVRASSNALAATSTMTYSAGLTDRAGEFWVGRQDTGLVYAAATIDELSFWKKVTSAQEDTDLFGATTGNTYSSAVNAAGYGSFDFGAGTASGTPLRQLVVAAGTGIYASSNRGLTFVVVATDRRTDFQEFVRSKNLLIAVHSSHSVPLYWAGSVGTFFLRLAAGSAMPAKHAMDFGGFLHLMNESGGNGLLVRYQDNNTLTTGTYTNTYSVGAQGDDEITGGIPYNKRAYIFTKTSVHQVTAVGGNPDFAVLPVKEWGAVPRTIEKVTLQDIGEVIICLGWDKKIRIFDGAEDRILSTNIEQANGQAPVYLDGINTDHLLKCHAKVDANKQVYKLAVVMAPSTEVTHTLNLNLRTGAWYADYRPNLNTMTMADSANSKILVGVKRDGYVYALDSGNTEAGTAIDEYFISSLQVEKDPTEVRKRQKMDYFFAPTSSGTLHFQDQTNFRTGFPTVRDLLVLDGASTNEVVRKTVDMPLTENSLKVKISSSASTALPWQLLSMIPSFTEQGRGRA